MDDLKVILYLLAGVAWLVFRNYKKVTQQRPQMQEPPELAPPDVVPPVAEPSAATRREPVPVRPARVMRKQERKGAAAHSPVLADSDPAYAFSPEVEAAGVADYFQHPQAAEWAPGAAAYAPEAPRRTQIGPIDLRMAVIYSAILHRPDDPFGETPRFTH